MTLAHAFAARQVFFTLEEPIRWFPKFTGNLTEFLVSLQRIERFLQCEEVNRKMVAFGDGEVKDMGIDVKISSANFMWGLTEKNGKSEIDKKADGFGETGKNRIIFDHFS